MAGWLGGVLVEGNRSWEVVVVLRISKGLEGRVRSLNDLMYFLKRLWPKNIGRSSAPLYTFPIFLNLLQFGVAQFISTSFYQQKVCPKL